MALIRADLGSPRLAVCPRCKDGRAAAQPIVVVNDMGVTVEPWVLLTCRSCGYLAKHHT
jgi:hypothetical protein